MTSGKQTFDYDGKIAGLYDLSETIGSGHFAVVKLARHVFTGEKVAVKVIDKNKLDPVSRAHLFQEVRCMKLVQHPHVVRLYEVIDTQTKLYLILELGDGGDMYDYIMKHDRGLDVDLARIYFQQIVEAISYCHNLHVVHRDLKPENVIFFEKLGVVKLTDFGFSNKYDPGTKLETSCGSLAYSAPEILLGDSYDAPAVDVWSLGVLLYMLVCGTPPFQEANDSETLTMIMDCKYHVPAHIPQGCKSLIAKMLCREPSDRATLHEIVTDAWLSAGRDGKNVSAAVKGALVATQRLPDDDHDAIVDRMVEGNIASRHEVVRCLLEDEYNHVTATYYLLAERILARRRQRELADSAAASGSTAGGPGDAVGNNQSLTRQSSVPAANLPMAMFRSHRLDHLGLTVSDASRELKDASEAISALAVSPTLPLAVSLSCSSTLPSRARKHSLIREEDEEYEDGCEDGGGECNSSGDEGGAVFGRAQAPSAVSGRSEVHSRVDTGVEGHFWLPSDKYSRESTASPRRHRSSTSPGAASAVALPQPVPSRQLRSVCSSPQLLKLSSAAATSAGLRQIHEDAEATSASDGVAEDDEDGSLDFPCENPRVVDRRQTLPSPATARRLRVVRRKLRGGEKKKPCSGSSDTSDTDDADKQRSVASDALTVCATHLACKRKDSTSSGDTDSAAGPAVSGGGRAGHATSGAAALSSSTATESPSRKKCATGSSGTSRSVEGCNPGGGGVSVLGIVARTEEHMNDSAAVDELRPCMPRVLVANVCPASMVSALTADKSAGQHGDFSIPLPGQMCSSPAMAGDVLPASTFFSPAPLTPGCVIPEPSKATVVVSSSAAPGLSRCENGGSSSRSSSCSTVNLRYLAGKIVEGSVVSRMSNFSLASNASSLSLASSKSSNGVRSGGDFSRSTPRLSRYGSKKFNKAKLIQVLAKEFSDLSESHSHRNSIASLYLEDVVTSTGGVHGLLSPSLRDTDINENSIASPVLLMTGNKLSTQASAIAKKKNEAAECCAVM